MNFYYPNRIQLREVTNNSNHLFVKYHKQSKIKIEITNKLKVNKIIQTLVVSIVIIFYKYEILIKIWSKVCLILKRNLQKVLKKEHKNNLFR